MSKIRISTPLDDNTVAQLKSGDNVLINGIIYTGRDAAHKRLLDLLEKGATLPFDIAGQIIYFVGPTPARPGRPVGSAGPKNCYRMVGFSPQLIAHGLHGMIGNGSRLKEVLQAMQKHFCVDM